MLVLGIETSCDETAAAVVSDGAPRIRANLVLSQLAEHRPYGGVVPEIAARAHLDHLDGLIARALAEAGIGFGELDAVAATGGPGLIGGVIVGVMEAKAIALARGLPSSRSTISKATRCRARLEQDVGVSLSAAAGLGRALPAAAWSRASGAIAASAPPSTTPPARRSTRARSCWACAIPAARRSSARRARAMPRAFRCRGRCSGGRAAISPSPASRPRCAQRGGADAARSPRDRADLAASLQAAIADCLVDRTRNAIALFRARPAVRTLVVAGGVAANRALRARLAALAAASGLAFVAPPPALCTDNGAMIAWAGIERLAPRPHRRARFRAAPALAARSRGAARIGRRGQGMTPRAAVATIGHA